MLVIGKRTRVPRPVFRDRLDAGRRLVELLDDAPDPDAIVLGIPRGGVLTGAPLSERLGAPLGVVLVRKLPVPASPETGFGAVAIDGSVVLNDELIIYFGIPAHTIDRIVTETRRELVRRSAQYTDSARALDLRDRDVYVVDDGLATGYTAVAAAQMLRKQSPRSLTLAVPCSTAQTLEFVEPHFDRVGCLMVQESSPFAVAAFYDDFHDLADGEVRAVLRQKNT